MTNQHAATGVSIGATNLAGARAGQAVVHPAVLRTGSGAWLSGFVERIGDPVPLIASDGTAHQPEQLLADALDATARAVGHPAHASGVTVSVPAHWPAGTVDVLRAQLPSATLIPDTVAAIAALRAGPGLPSHGVIVLCDFGGSGSSISLVDAAGDDAPIGSTVRFPDFSGDLVDQAILGEVLAGVADAAPTDPAGTAMVRSLTRLRESARLAKHRLSAETATAVAGDHTNIRLTRAELERLIEAPFTGFLSALTDTLDRFGVSQPAVSAVATFGGGARIPILTQRLSAHLQVPVVTTAQPHLTAATGAAILARNARVIEPLTTVTPTAGNALPTALAWAEDPDQDTVYAAAPIAETAAADGRPRLQFADTDRGIDTEWEPVRRRGPLVAFGVAAAAALTALAVYGLTSFGGDTSTPVAASVATVTQTSTTESAAPVVNPAPVAAVTAAPIAVPVVQVPRQRVPQRTVPATTTVPATAPPTTTTPTTTTPTTTPATTTPTTTQPTPPPSSQPPTTTTTTPSNGGINPNPRPIDPGAGAGTTTTQRPIDPGTGASRILS